MVTLLQLLGQFCVLYLPIKREKAAEETVAFSTHRGKHLCRQQEVALENHSLTNRRGKRIPVRGMGHSMCAYPCITLMPPHQKPDDVQATSRGLYTK